MDEGTQGVPGFCFPDGFVPQKVIKKSRRHTREGTHTPSRLAMMAASLLGARTAAAPEPPAAALPTVTIKEEDFVRRHVRRTSSITPVSGATTSAEGSTAGDGTGRKAHSLRAAAAAGAAGVASPPSPSGEGPARPAARSHRRAASESESVDDVLADSYLDSANSSVLVLTGHTGIRYCVCVVRDYIAAANESDIVVQSMCFCVVTTAAFLTFHRAFLIALLQATPDICDLVALAPDRLAHLIACAQQAASVAPVVAVSATTAPAALDGSSCPATDTPSGDSNSSGNSNNTVVHIPQSAEEAEEAVKRVDALVDARTDAGTAVGSTYERQFGRALLSVVQYCALRVPEEQHALRFFVGGAALECARCGTGCDEESDLLLDYAGEVLFRALPVRVVVQLLTALLLEYQIVLVSPNARLLTAAVLALLPLTRPFEFAGVIISLLPRAMEDVFDAPFPLIAGVASPPQFRTPPGLVGAGGAGGSGGSGTGGTGGGGSGTGGTAGCDATPRCVVNLHTAALQTTRPLPALPEQATLTRMVEDFLRRAAVPQPQWKGLGSDVERAFAHTMSVTQLAFLSAIFQGHFSQLVQDFERHCISDIGSAQSTTVFLKESFVETRDAREHAFLRAFVDTQMFKVFEDKKLLELDREKTEHRQSLRSGRHSATARPAAERRPTRISAASSAATRSQGTSTTDADAPEASSDAPAPAATEDGGGNAEPSEGDGTNPVRSRSASKSSRTPRPHRHHHHHTKDDAPPDEDAAPPPPEQGV